MLHKGAWIAAVWGTLVGVQDYKKVKFPVKGLENQDLYLFIILIMFYIDQDESIPGKQSR